MSAPENSTPTRDAVTVLRDEHDGLQTLFSRVSGVDEDRPAILRELMQLLSMHVSVEKQLLLPVLQEHGGSDGDSGDGDPGAGDPGDRDPGDRDSMVRDLSSYHDEVGRVLVLLDRRKVNSPDVPDLVTELLDLTERHVAQADEVVFPALSEALDARQLTELGERMVSDERQLLTHPHPHLPEKGPLGKLARAAASVVDSVRDGSTDVGRSAS